VTDTITQPEADARVDEPESETSADAPRTGRRRTGAVRRTMMRPRRILVRVHRWLGIGMFAWFVVISLTGAWLAVHEGVESWINPGRYERTPGDVGAEAAVDAADAALPDDAYTYGLTMPRNGRGVYQVYGELDPPVPGDAPEDYVSPIPPRYYTIYVDPGTGEVNEMRDDAAGASPWLFRGHELLWQDHGPFNVFHPATGWCRAEAGHEPGGMRGVVCDVIPDGMDMVGWFAIGFIVVLLSGFYLWYWPGVRRWATALVIRRGRGRFAFNLSVHKVVGIVVWVPLLIVAFTGAAFAFPNMGSWFENATPANRDLVLWEHPEDLVSSEANGRDPIGFDEAVEIFQTRYPDRALNYVGGPFDETGMYEAWVTRGFDPWTREGGAGNTLVALDQYTGETLYDGSPEDGNVFDQAWDDWSYPLHTGDFGGTTTRVLWVGLGLSPIILGVTGITMALVRRRKRANRSPVSQLEP